MSIVPESRQKRLLYVLVGLALIGFGLVQPAAALVFPEATAAGTAFVAGPGAPQVTLSAPSNVAPGAPISATATSLAGVSSIAVGYCPGWTCSAAFATEFASATGGVLNTNWTTPPPDGIYTLLAYAVGVDGAGGESSPVTVTVDRIAPDTTIASAPDPAVAVDSATFTFGSSEPGSFQCKVDGAATFIGCSSPVTYWGVSAGTHKLTVRAVDLAGNVDGTPAVTTWKALAPTAPPDTTITSAPASLVNSRNASIG